MSIKTGMHRMAQVFRAIGVLAAPPFLFLLFAEFKGGEGLVWLAVAALAYAVFWAIAWVLDGFAKE